MRLAACALLWLVGGCFQPDLGPGRFACAIDADCPEGQLCQAKLCVAAVGAEGCARGGAKLTAQVSACRGPFAAGASRALCASGYHVCGESLPADNAPLNQLNAYPDGFFALSLDVYLQSADARTLYCAAAAGARRVILGCGKNAVAPIQEVKDTDTTSCRSVAAGLLRAGRLMLVCDAQADASPWRCQDGLVDAAHTPSNEATGGGVLCCKS